MWHLGTMPVVDECHDLVVNALLWTTLALIAVVLRLITRGVIVKRTGWDDYLMAAAMVGYSSIFISPFQYTFRCSVECFGTWDFKTWPEPLVLTYSKPPWLFFPHLAQQLFTEALGDWRLTV